MSRSDRPPSSVDPSVGQRLTSALVDVVFFGIVGLLGMNRVLSEPTLAVLLGSYASYRFGIAAGKQQTVIALSRDHGGTGGSGGYGAVAPRVDPRADPPWEQPKTPPRGRFEESEIQHDA